MTAVAVIGAGAAGLVTAVELRAAGHDVVVFEQSDEVGGVWVYDEAPGRTMYDSLRTNLPRDLMAFRSYPFDSRGGGEDHWPRFPGHRQVLEYLQRFAVAHDVTTITEFGTAVTAVAEAEAGWSIETVAETGTTAREFGAVAVCNGHFTTRRAPPLAQQHLPSLREGVGQVAVVVSRRAGRRGHLPGREGGVEHAAA